MKRFVKKSLITALAIASASSSAMSADTLADAFKNGKVNGALKSYYFADNFDDNAKNDDSIWVNGGMLSYSTDSFHGIKLGSTFQASSVTSIDDVSKNQAKFLDASGAVLSEAYLEYKYKNTSFKGGRQFIKLPLIKGSGSRLIKESFEGYFLTNTDIPNTLISLGKVTKYQTRTDENNKVGTNAASFDKNGLNEGTGSVGDFYDVGKDGKGAYSLYIQNKSIDNLKLQLHYVDFRDEVKDLYLDGVYSFKTEFKPFIAAQFYNSDYDDSEKETTQFMGYKVGATFFGVKTHVSYTKADKDGAVTRGLGEAATASFTSAGSTVNNYAQGAKTWQVGLSKKFGNLVVSTKYTKTTNSVTEKKDLKQLFVGLKYNFQGQLKNLSLSTEFHDYSNGNGAESKDKKEFRTRLIYKF